MANVRALAEPRVELQLKVELVRERPAGLETALDEVLQPLDDALGLRIARLAEMPVDAQLAAERGELLGRASAPACNPAWRSQTSVCGSAPSDHRQREIPASRSGAWLEKTSAPAPARE